MQISVFLADLRYMVHILVFCIWIKQINKVNVTMCAKMVNILTLRSKNKKNAFKAKLNLLKNKNNKQKKSTN